MPNVTPLPELHPGTPPSHRVLVDLMLVQEVRDGYVVGFPGLGRPCDAIGRARLTHNEGSCNGTSRRGLHCRSFSLTVSVYGRICRELNGQIPQPEGKR